MISTSVLACQVGIIFLLVFGVVMKEIVRVTMVIKDFSFKICGD